MESNYKIAQFADLLKVPVSENGEKLIDVRNYNKNIVAKYEKDDMIPYTGKQIFVRDTVAEKLARVSSNLLRQYRFSLKIVYGYRHPEVQKKYFQRRRVELRKNYPDIPEEELDALTHNFVAHPSVAGHPTGGAIDVTILDSEENHLDMGTGIADFNDSEKIKTFASSLNETQKKNRAFLHDLMIQEGFAPFYGEWWHFSYGDKEWAWFYKKSNAIYSPISFRLTKE